MIRVGCWRTAAAARGQADRARAAAAEALEAHDAIGAVWDVSRARSRFRAAGLRAGLWSTTCRTS